MTAKRKSGSPQAVIEVWREGDRVLIGVPSAERATRSSAEPFPSTELLEELKSARWRSLAKQYQELVASASSQEAQIDRDRLKYPLAENTGRIESGVGDVEADMLVLTEEEWMVANLLALQREAGELSRSVDETRAYVAERCAAIETS